MCLVQIVQSKWLNRKSQIIWFNAFDSAIKTKFLKFESDYPNWIVCESGYVQSESVLCLCWYSKYCQYQLPIFKKNIKNRTGGLFVLDFYPLICVRMIRFNYFGTTFTPLDNFFERNPYFSGKDFIFFRIPLKMLHGDIVRHCMDNVNLFLFNIITVWFHNLNRTQTGADT